MHSVDTPQLIVLTRNGKTSGGSDSLQVVSEPMDDTLWVDSLGSMDGRGLAQRLSKEREDPL